MLERAKTLVVGLVDNSGAVATARIFGDGAFSPNELAQSSQPWVRVYTPLKLSTLGVREVYSASVDFFGQTEAIARSACDAFYASIKITGPINNPSQIINDSAFVTQYDEYVVVTVRLTLNLVATTV